MPRVITSVSFDLKFNVLATPPAVNVAFTDVDAAGRETHGKTSLVGPAASEVFPGTSMASMLANINVGIDAQAAAVKEPGTVAARIEACDVARRQLWDLNAEIAAKKAELAKLAP